MIAPFRSIFSAVTVTQSAPLDTAQPSIDTAATAPAGVRGSQFLLELELYGTSGTLTATIDLYVWDATAGRWAKLATPISLSTTATAAGPAARTIYALDNIQPYGAVLPVISAIGGTGATCSARGATNGP